MSSSITIQPDTQSLRDRVQELEKEVKRLRDENYIQAKEFVRLNQQMRALMLHIFGGGTGIGGPG
jgi:cell division protein FtsB